MGILTAIRSSIAPGRRRLNRLATISGASEQLAENIRHHAELCEYPRIKEGLIAAAAAEKAEAQVLRDLVLKLGRWPAPADRQTVGSSASNWARISSDLAAEVELVRSLSAAIAEWEGSNPPIGERLRELRAARERTLGLLRDLAVKCDPQALD
jgi:hypothetical protein